MASDGINEALNINISAHVFPHDKVSEAILAMTNEILKSLIDDILKHVTSLFILAEAVALLDMLQVRIHGS